MGNGRSRVPLGFDPAFRLGRLRERLSKTFRRFPSASRRDARGPLETGHGPQSRPGDAPFTGLLTPTVGLRWIDDLWKVAGRDGLGLR